MNLVEGVLGIFPARQEELTFFLLSVFRMSTATHRPYTRQRSQQGDLESTGFFRKVYAV